MNQYSELLARPEWKAKRLEVLSRSGCCDDCGRAQWTRRLEVHHLYYELGRLPWDYPISALTGLCRECHRLRHGLSRAPLRSKIGNILAGPPTCSRCDGQGYISEFKHVEDGVCFRCWGSGYDFEKAAELYKTEPNQSLQTTIRTVTECAPSRTFRASSDRV